MMQPQESESVSSLTLRLFLSSLDAAGVTVHVSSRRLFLRWAFLEGLAVCHGGGGASGGRARVSERHLNTGIPAQHAAISYLTRTMSQDVPCSSGSW